MSGGCCINRLMGEVGEDNSNSSSSVVDAVDWAVLGR